MLALPVLCIHSITKCSREDGASLAGDPAGGRPASSRRYRQPNRLGIDGGLMCDVIFVAEEKLERMLSEWKRDLCLGLSRAKMQVIKIIWNGLIQRRGWGGQPQRVVAGVGFFDHRPRPPHGGQDQTDERPTRHPGSPAVGNAINDGSAS